MRRQRRYRQALEAALVGFLLLGVPAVLAEQQVTEAPVCVLQSMDLIIADSTARLVLLTDGPPASLGTRIEPNEGIVLDLASCISGSEVSGRSFDEGLVAGLELVQTGPTLAVVVEARRPFEYSVSSKQDRVEVTLRPATPALSLVRVLEPLPIPSAPDSSPAPPPPDLQPQAVAAVQPIEPAVPETEPEAAPKPTTTEQARNTLKTERSFAAQLVDGARVSIERAPAYDSGYSVIAYPNGDPGWDKGSGVDLIVRTYRQLGIDLQQLIHEDILAAGRAYGVREPDANIDHRRVRNLATFFERHGQTLPLSDQAEWRAGDVIFWALDSPRINSVGIVSDQLGASGQPMVIHHSQNSVPEEQDILSDWPIASHFRWWPPLPSQ